MNSILRTVREFLETNRAEVLIFLAVFGVRFLYSLVVLFGFGQDAFVSYLDAEVFVREANNLLEHGVMSQFVEPPYLPDPLRTPLYIWFLALFLKLGFSLFGIAIVQNLLIAFSGILLYRIGLAVFKEPAPGFLAAGLFALEPSSVYWSVLLMSDVLFAFLMVAAVYCFTRARWYAAAAIFGFATLARPVGLYLFPLLLLMTVVNYFHASAAGFRERLAKTGIAPLFKRLALMTIIFSCIVAPWMVRNTILFNHFELSTAGWLNLYIFTVKEFATGKGLELPMPSVPDGYYRGAYREVFYNYEFEAADFFKGQTQRILQQFPLAYPIFHAMSGIRGLGNHDYRYLWDHVIVPTLPTFPVWLGEIAVRIGEGVWWVVYVGVAVGFLFAGRRHWQVFLLFLVLGNALLTGYNGVISSGGRYQIPFLPFTILLGSFGILMVFRSLRKHFRSGDFL